MMQGFYTGRRLHSPTFLAFFLLLIGCFGVGYYRGVRSRERGFIAAYDKAVGQGQHLSVMLETCESNLFLISGELLLQSDFMKRVTDKSTDIEQEIRKIAQKLGKTRNESENPHSTTLAIVDNEAKGNVLENVKKDKGFLKDMEEKLQIMLNLVRTLTEREGIIGLPGCSLLKSVRQRYKRLCNNFPGCTLISDDSLVQRWKNTLQHLMQQRAAREASIMKKMLWRYDREESSKGAVGIRFLNTDRKNVTTPPTFFGHIGNPPLVVGREEAALIAVTTVLERLLVVQQLAFCAYHYRMSNITVPSLFFWGGNFLNYSPAFLHLLVQTPLLNFCVKCTDTGRTAGGAAPMCSDTLQSDDLYGKREFWVSRSMVVPHPEVVLEAETYLNKHASGDKKILAVVLHSSLKDCLGYLEEPRGNHFLYLWENFPEDRAQFAGHATDDTIYQCSPTVAQFVQRVSEVLEDKGPNSMGPAFGIVYITTSRGMLAQLKELEVKPSWWHMVLFRSEGSASARDELVDLNIASYADGLLLGSFCSSSQYVLENFLLRYGLKSGGRVWFF